MKSNIGPRSRWDRCWMVGMVLLCSPGILAIEAERSVTRCTFTYFHPLLNRCETWIASLDPPPAWSEPRAETPQPLPIGGDVQQRRLAVAARARSMLAKPSFQVGDRTYPEDCSGLVMATLLRQLHVSQFTQITPASRVLVAYLPQC